MSSRNKYQHPDSSESHKPRKSPKRRGCLKSLILLLFLMVIIKGFFIDFYKIPTGSMEKTLLIGDYIMINKFSYKLSTPYNIPFTEIDIPHADLVNIKKPEINDVIVFEFPGQLNEYYPPFPFNYVKRIIGKPGDTVEITVRRSEE